MDIKIYRNRLIDGKYEKRVVYSVPLDNTDSQLASKDAKERVILFLDISHENGCYYYSVLFLYPKICNLDKLNEQNHIN